MATFTDQLNRKIEIHTPPKRIISLVPSQTELLYDLGLKDEVIGITKFCIHPAAWTSIKSIIGGTKKIDFEKINSLKPDLIIGNKEENTKEEIEKLMQLYPVWLSDINTLTDALDMITSIGALTGKQQTSINLKLGIQANFQMLSDLPKMNLHKKTAYFIWRKPYMVVGNNTFINDMLERCGLENIFSTKNYARYPEINTRQLVEAAPEIIFLSSEPYPFKEKHIEELKAIVPHSKIKIVDGELFSWYGSRILQSPKYFRKLIEELN